MSSSEGYALLDFGDGRRLERFGRYVLDRPCPAAEGFRPADAASWNQADARFEGRNDEQGAWTYRGEMPKRWTVAFGRLRFELKRTDFGHLGLFPEQAENWRWLESVGGRRIKVLNLFAYTGGSTLAAAVAGMEVVHVDAAKNVVAWARRNAELSGLADAPIRWIAEETRKFVKRELKRGNRYGAVILDPPSYGHGPRGEVWRLAKHLPRLLRMCVELTAGRPEFMLLTCHTPGYDADKLIRMLSEAGVEGNVVGRQMSVPSADGRKLPAGVVVQVVGQAVLDLPYRQA